MSLIDFLNAWSFNVKTKMTEQTGVQKILIDGLNSGQHLVEHRNDGFIALHGQILIMKSYTI